MTSLRINGQEHDLDIPDDMPLLWVLRDVVGLTGTKFGCGVALCGACTVHVDGRPIRSCITPIANVVGKKVTTIEAIGDTESGAKIRLPMKPASPMSRAAWAGSFSMSTRCRITWSVKPPPTQRTAARMWNDRNH